MTCNDNEVKEYLLDNSFPVTFSLKRYHRGDNLISSLKPIYELYQSRISIIALVTYFKLVLESFIESIKKRVFHNFIKRKVTNNI